MSKNKGGKFKPRTIVLLNDKGEEISYRLPISIGQMNGYQELDFRLTKKPLLLDSCIAIQFDEGRYVEIIDIPRRKYFSQNFFQVGLDFDSIKENFKFV